MVPLGSLVLKGGVGLHLRRSRTVWVILPLVTPVVSVSVTLTLVEILVVAMHPLLKMQCVGIVRVLRLGSRLRLT